MNDPTFDAQFGSMDLEGRDPAHWRLLHAAVMADLAGDAATAAPYALGLPSPAMSAALRRQIAQPRAPRARYLVPVAFALAALGLFALRTPEHADPQNLVPRGIGDPAISAPRLDIAVRSASGTARMDPTRAYAADDTLIFQVTLATPATLTLSRADALGTSLVWSGALSEGTHTLPTGYALEPGEREARFVLDDGAAQTVVTVRAPR